MKEIEEKIAQANQRSRAQFIVWVEQLGANLRASREKQVKLREREDAQKKCMTSCFKDSIRKFQEKFRESL